MANYVGIDPGKSGAIASVGEINDAIKMPLQGKDIDCKAIADFLLRVKPESIVLEKVGAMPGQGVTSMFNFGKFYGIIIGIIETLGFSYQLVTPQKWKKHILEGTKKDKDAAIEFVRRRYPDIELVPPRCRKPHDGIADAVCMAQLAKDNN